MDKFAYIAIFGKTYSVKEKLKKVGLKWTGKSWAGKLSLAKIDKLKEFCRQYDLQYVIEGENIKESRLARGKKPISITSNATVMGEGRFQWLIEETLDIERKRQRKNP